MVSRIVLVVDAPLVAVRESFKVPPVPALEGLLATPYKERMISYAELAKTSMKPAADTYRLALFNLIHLNHDPVHAFLSSLKLLY